MPINNGRCSFENSLNASTAALLIPVEDGWDSLIDSLNEFSDDFMKDRGQPKQQDREDAF